MEQEFNTVGCEEWLALMIFNEMNDLAKKCLLEVKA